MAEVFKIQNVSTNIVELKQFGLVLSASEIVELEDYDQAILSDELETYLLNGDVVRLIGGSQAPADKIFSFTNQLYDDYLLESSLGFGIVFDGSSSKFVVDSSEFVTNTKFDASINQISEISSSEYATYDYVDGSLVIKSDLSYVNSTFLKESSLGSQFYFQDGSLFVIDVSGSGGVSQAYVDGSLAKRDASIIELYDDKVDRAGDTMYGQLEFISDDPSTHIGGSIYSSSDGILILKSGLAIALSSPYLVLPDSSDNVGSFLTIGERGIVNFTTLNTQEKIWTDTTSADFTINNTLETSILTVIPNEDVSFGSGSYEIEVDLPWWRDVWCRIYVGNTLYSEEKYTGDNYVIFSDSIPIDGAGISSGSQVYVTIQSDVANYTVKQNSFLNIKKFGNNITAEWGSITGTLSNQIDLSAALDLKADKIYVDGSLNVKADISYVDTTFLRESSLGSGFVWNGNKVDVSIDSGVSQAYVDGSLAARDLSINYLYNYNSIQDASIYDLILDVSTLEDDIDDQIAWNGQQDSSIENLRNRINIIDGSILYLDSSIQQLFNQKADLSYVDTTFLRESSIGTGFVWNSGKLDVSTSGSGVSQAYVDGSLAARDLSINYLYGYNSIQDASIYDLILDVSTLEDDIDDQIAWNGQQDASIVALEASLGDYVRKDGDTMTGPLNTTALNVSSDVSIVGSLYLGDVSNNNSEDTNLLAVVTESGKVVATTIPASNVSSEVIDVSTDIDVSILSGYYYVDTTYGNVTLTIPDPSADNDGKVFGILKKTNDNNIVTITTATHLRNIGGLTYQTITQQDKGISIVSDLDNDKWLIVQDSRYLEGDTQGEFQYWDVSTKSWQPTSNDITWDNIGLHFTVGGNSSPPTFEVDASQDIVYINALDISGLVPADNLGFYAGGRGAFGNEVTIDRLRNNVPGNVPRALSLIDTHAVMRVWRYVNDGNDPAVEFVWGIEDAPGDPSNNWWDMYLDGDPSGNDSFSIRSRTVPYGNIKLLTVYRDHTQIESTTESYDPSSGSLQVFGGAGISGNLYTKGAVNPGGSETISAFPDASTGGDMYYRTDLNQMFVYDASRGKWLSIDRATYVAGSNKINSSTTGYMDVGRGTMSSATGFRMPKNGTILGATIQNRSNVSSSRQMSIRINDVSAYTVIIPVSNPGGAVGTNGNADFNKNDIIQVVLEKGGSTMRDIQVSFEVAWRE